MAQLTVRHESWPIKGSFTISRGSKTHADVVYVELTRGEARGHGECVPYARYGESIDSVIGLIEGLRGDIEQGLDRHSLQQALPAGAARNALDCALWDLKAKLSGRPVQDLAGITVPETVTTAYTLSLDTPDNMRDAAVKNSWAPLLKLKLGGPRDLDCIRAVRAGAPDARIIVDANEGWSVADYQTLIPALVEAGVEMIEQPFPAQDDEVLASLDRPITICADESCHDTASLHKLQGRYDMINIKLDKTGGLTEALRLQQNAEARGFQIMVGCMLATSLAMAPALLLGGNAQVIDLDGPLLLDKDRQPGLVFDKAHIHQPDPALWG